MMIGGKDGSRNADTAEGGFVLVSLYSWATITMVVLIARFVRGLFVHKIHLGLDDATAFVGNVIYLGAVVAWQWTVNGGLGKHIAIVSQHDAATFSKAFLSAQLLEVFAMTMAKFSSALLMERVAPQSRKVKIALFAMLVVYCIFATLAIAFRCGIPSSWAYRAQHCGNGGLLVTAITFNLLTDLVLAAWLLPTLVSLSLDKEKRLSAMVLFGSRSIVSLVAVAQIWASLKAISSKDPTFDTVDFAVISQAVSSLSLIVANVPRIKRILGIGGGGILHPEIQASELTATRSRQFSADNGLELVPTGSGKFTTTVTCKGSRHRKKGKAPADWQGLVSLGSKEDEHTSTSSLVDRADQDGVMLEREFEVVVEDRACNKR